MSARPLPADSRLPACSPRSGCGSFPGVGDGSPNEVRILFESRSAPCSRSIVTCVTNVLDFGLLSTSTRRAKITAVSHYLPERRVTNKDLEKVLDTSDEWIMERTGISERHFVE